MLLIIIDDGIHHVHHGLGGKEHGLHVIQPVVALEEGVWHTVPTAVVLLAQVLYVFPVAGETGGAGLQALKAKALRLIPAGYVGGCLETCGVGIAVVFQKLRTAHIAEPLVDIAHNLIATRGQDIGGQPVVTTAHHAMVGLQMQVVAAMECLLAMGGDISAKVGLIGRLIVGETRIAIEAIGAVLHREMSHRRVERGDTHNSLLHTLFEVGTNGIVLLFMRLKPLTTIIGRQLLQVLQYSFCIHKYNFSAKIRKNNKNTNVFQIIIVLLHERINDIANETDL